MIFVFGSNLAGRHGKGAAKTALDEHGAIYGRGVGMQGQSYAIPTKGYRLETLSVHDISKFVNDFKKYAHRNPHLRFNVTRVGCGLAGYSDNDIAPLFWGAPRNCQLPEGWRMIARRAHSRP
jgi:hypothetical protein